MTPPPDPHYRHRCPAEIISHAVWLYHVFGATHTRFAHSIGVLHMARLLMQVIQRDLGNQYHPHRAQVALAAALVHDVGNGKFSHAFEEIGRKLNLPLAHHETVSERLIRDSGIARALDEFGGGFAQDVANVVKGGKPGSLYDSVVSSQFDADRLNYMQRDRHCHVNSEW